MKVRCDSFRVLLKNYLFCDTVNELIATIPWGLQIWMCRLYVVHVTNDLFPKKGKDFKPLGYLKWILPVNCNLCDVQNLLVFVRTHLKNY